MKNFIYVILFAAFSCNNHPNEAINFSNLEIYIGGDLKIYNFYISEKGNVDVVEKTKTSIHFYKLKLTNKELDSLRFKTEKMFKSIIKDSLKHSYAGGTTCKVNVYRIKDTISRSSVFGTQDEALDSLCSFILNLSKIKEKEHFFNEYSENFRTSVLVPPNVPID